MTTKPQTSKLFNNDWARDISKFLDNPTGFISTSGKTAEVLIDEMLMVISTSSTVLSLRLAILHVFVNVGLFQTSKNYLIKIVTSLEDLSYQFVDQKDNLFLHQLLAAFTTLSIEVDERFLQDSTQLKKCIDLLLVQANQVADGTRSERVLLRSVACNCLLELEEVYPGILSSKLSYFFQYCQLEKTFIRQHYLSLFCTVLRNSLLNFKSIELEEQASCLQFFFCPTTELLPFIPPKNFRDVSKDLLCSPIDCNLSPNLDKIDLKKSFSTLLDATTNMTPTVLALTMHVLADCVHISGVHPSMLKTIYHRYLHSSSIVLLQLVYSLKVKFGRELFDLTREASFERSIFWALNNPHNLNPHTLLFYTWLLHFPVLDSITQRIDNRVPSGLPLFQICYPTPFDSVDLTVRCFHIFSASELILEDPRSINTHISVLAQRVKAQPGSFATPAFFHTLYLFLHRSHPTSMVESIRVILTDLYLSYPMLSQYLLNFIVAITAIVPASAFARPILSQIMEHLQKQRQVRTSDLVFHLQLVEYAALTPKFNLDSILVLLNSVLQPEVVEEGDWYLGHIVLDVCRAVLLGIHSDPQFQRACAILYRIKSNFTDVDVSDEAGFLLTLITSVSSKKYRPLLSRKSETNTEPSLKDLVVGTTFQLTAPITYIPEIFLQLEKIPIKMDTSPTIQPPQPVVRNPTEILKQYLSAADQLIDASFQLDFFLSYAPHAKPSRSMQTVYAVSLHLGDNSLYHPTTTITVPKLVYQGKDIAQKDKRKVSFEFRPKLPLPTSFSVSAIFSLQDGATYQTPLTHLEVSFSDIILPLPQGISQQDVPSLFEALWSHLSQRCFSEHNMESKCTESFIKLNKPSHSVTHILQQALSRNIVTSSDEKIHLLLYIPPRHHMLLKARVSTESTDVSILTDEWRLLSHFNQYMHALLAQM